MNILVLSDTHGNIQPALDMIERVGAWAPIDHLIHCGDHYRDAMAISEQTGIPVTAAKGNCDGLREREYKILETSAGKILVTHGHMEDVKFSTMGLYYLAQENGCRMACFGHTHVPYDKERGSVRLINPGSLTDPRGGHAPSCVLVVATEKALEATRVDY